MYCNQWGKNIPDGSSYCNFCGAEQNGKKSTGFFWFLGLLVVVAVLWVYSALKPVDIQIPKGKNLQTVSLSVADESRQLGDGGYCAVFETLTPVTNCSQVTLTLQAEGNHGATTKGNWEVHFRIGGEWKKIQTIYYSGIGQEDFTILFDPVASFDAVCAFPTQRGNYSYQSSMALSDAYCE